MSNNSKAVTISLIVAGLIAAAVLILSYFHGVGLFERSGYHNAFAHIGVIGFELTFVFGTGISLWTKLQGEQPAGSTRFIMWLGILVNLYSNVTSGIATDGQPLIFFSAWGIPIGEPVLIGALIPLLFWSAERIVMDCISIYLGKTEHIEQSNTEQEEVEPNKQNESIEQVEAANIPIVETVHTEQKETEHPSIQAVEQPIEQTELAPIEQHAVYSEHPEQEETAQDEPNKTERTNLYVLPKPNKRTTEQTAQTEQPNKPNTEQNKSNKPSKTEQAVKYVQELIEQNKGYTTRSIAKAIGCSPSTAQTAISRAKQMVQ